MKPKSLKLGIVGGLGARGSADILNKIVAATPVQSERDHREIIFEQKPMTETIQVSDSKYRPIHRKFHVFDALSRMENMGCDAVLLPCFITHTFLNELRPEFRIELISLKDAIRFEIMRQKTPATRIGVLTTPYVRRKRFFEGIVENGTKVFYPDSRSEAEMLDGIYGPLGFKSGATISRTLNNIMPAIHSLTVQGVDLIIPGMTELPIFFTNTSSVSDIPIVDVNDLYARHALECILSGKKEEFKIGVVGGVGPAATVDFFRKVVLSTAANCDQDHIKVVIEQNPQIPDRTESLLGEGIDPTISLYATCKKLQLAGAKIIAIPCNTAHAYSDRLQRYLDVPIVNMLSETVRYIAGLKTKPTRVAILATDGTIATGLYQSKLTDCSMTPVLPSSDYQKGIMEAIYGTCGVKSGKTSGLCSVYLQNAIEDVISKGAEVVILGCTELPLIEINCTNCNLIDPTEILAKACVQLVDKL